MPSDKIRPAGQSEFIRHLNYGDPGCGKTSYIGTGGKGTLLIRPNVDHVPRTVIGTGVDEWVVRDYDELWQVLEFAQHEGHTYEWIWLDSISLFQDIGLDDIWAGVIASKPSRRSFGLDKGEYQVNMWRIQEWIRFMVGCEAFHFGVTAHSFWGEMTTEEDPDEKITKLMPWVQGKSMPQKISGYMTLVTYMDVKAGKEGRRIRRFHTRGSERFYAKDQYDAFGDKGIMVDPTIPKVMKAIKAQTPAPVQRRRRRRQGGQ
jgi:AAA domain-containing protein